MLDAPVPVQREIAVSALGWWADAGVDVLIDEQATPWLDRGSPRAQPAAAPVPRPKTATSVDELVTQLIALPALDTFAAPAHRIAASGNPASDLMIAIDMPEAEDWRERHLIGGETGVLFEAMLKAIGRDRSTCYIVAMCPARLPGGSIPHELTNPLTAALNRHIELAAPKKLWAMGMAVNRAVIGADAIPGRGSLRHVNQGGGIVEAVASFSPRMLIQQPKRKAAAWADMQALMRGSDA